MLCFFLSSSLCKKHFENSYFNYILDLKNTSISWPLNYQNEKLVEFFTKLHGSTYVMLHGKYLAQTEMYMHLDDPTIDM